MDPMGPIPLQEQLLVPAFLRIGLQKPNHLFYQLFLVESLYFEVLPAKFHLELAPEALLLQSYPLSTYLYPAAGPLYLFFT
jgi:hypothetical protein